MSRSPEIRSLPLARAELRVEESGGKPVIRGYAAVFDVLSQELYDMWEGPFLERIQAGAFARTLREGADVRALVNHDRNLVLGRNKAGTLRLIEDRKGLHVEIDPPDSPVGRNYVESVRRGDIDGMSFRFYPVIQKFDDGYDPPVRTLIDVDIDDVSLATYPAYLDTEAGVRCFEEHRRSVARIESDTFDPRPLLIERCRIALAQ